MLESGEERLCIEATEQLESRKFLSHAPLGISATQPLPGSSDSLAIHPVSSYPSPLRARQDKFLPLSLTEKFSYNSFYLVFVCVCFFSDNKAHRTEPL